MRESDEQQAPEHDSLDDGPPFSVERPPFGRFWLRRLRLPEDIALVHSWVSRDYARYWGLVGRSPGEVLSTYREITRTADVFLGHRDDQPAFLVERYHPREHEIGQRYAVEPGDRGMHLLLAPAERREHGFSRAVFRVVMDFLFSDPEVERVVVEPDLRNARIHALNRGSGFRYAGVVRLPHKVAHLAFCRRADYQAALERERGVPRPPKELTAHLQPAAWAHANRRLVRKALSELAHERLLQPRPLGSDEYAVATDDPRIEYRFRARLLALEHWDLEAATIEKRVDGAPAALDARALVFELRDQLGLDEARLPVYLEELTSTLYAAAYHHAHEELSAADLVHAGFQELEAAMSEGHPAFLANSGRIGFDARDYLAFAPEAAAPTRLVWLGARRALTEVAVAADHEYQRLLDEELDGETRARFRAVLTGLGLQPEDYALIPAHPWQWVNRLALLYAPDLAARDLVYLGESPDRYRAQQSIRTFFNESAPHKRYVKTALSVLNMGFLRGLSADYLRATPAINDWVAAVLDGDPWFAERGFAILREVAAVGYRSPTFEGLVPTSSPYRKLLAALWRESPVPKLAPGQRLMTMAALLHRDRTGAALLPQLIAASDLSIDDWLDRYLGCYLAPVLHCLCKYELAFMPHGENILLVLEGHVPVRALLKDIGEEVVLMDPERPLPEAIGRIRAAVPEELRALSIFTDVFDGILRHVAALLLEQAEYPEARFWERVAACVHDYRRAQPAQAERLARLDLFGHDFPHSCLNRLQLRNNLQMVDLADPAGSLRFAGRLANPIARFSEEPAR